MQDLLANIKIQVNPKTYVKDPETSDLGKKIIKNSILLIDEIGFEEFTFKKLGEKIGSNESSIYRYFENKHKLLVYLSTDVNSTEFVNLGDLKGISKRFLNCFLLKKLDKSFVPFGILVLSIVFLIIPVGS